jgi:hypothetical protein
MKRKKLDRLGSCIDLAHSLHSEIAAPASKKAKKSALSKSNTTNIIADQSALDRRAQRFQREHEIERTKSVITFPPRAAPSLLQRTAAVTYASNGHDDPENDSVSTSPDNIQSA